jgi:hypothetical protein
MGLALVHRQLQPHHDRTHRYRSFRRVALAADHEIVRVVDDVGRPSLFKPQASPPLDEPSHVQVRHQWGNRSALRRAFLVVPVGTTARRAPLAVVVLDRRQQPRLNQVQDVPIDYPTRHAAQQFRMRNAVEGNVNRLPISKTFLKR